MMSPRNLERTRSVFPGTLRTWIDDHMAQGEEGLRAIQRHVMEIYARPLAAFLRGLAWRGSEDAEDAVQGFFASYLDRDGYLKQWRSSGKRLRTWLMKGFVYYLLDQRRQDRKLGRMEVLDPSSKVEDRDPSLEFDRAFAVTVTRASLRYAEGRCRQEGLEMHWKAFFGRYEERSYADIGGELGVTAARAAVMARTASIRFREALREILIRDGVRVGDVNQAIASLLEACGEGT